MNKFTLNLQTRKSHQEVAKAAIRAAVSDSDIAEQTLDEFLIAVEAAVENVREHAYDCVSDELFYTLYCEVKDDALSDNYIKVVITDTGKGIEDISKARQSFYTTSDITKHSGLGFTLMDCYASIVSVHSKPNAGTQVSLLKFF